MSTKIYYAHKVPINKLNLFIDITREKGFEIAKSIIKNIMKGVNVETTRELLEKEMSFSKGAFALTAEDRIRFMGAINICEKVASESCRAPGLDIEFHLNIWLRNDGYAYIIPIGEQYYKDIKYKEKWIKDFSYWNNSDKPEEVTEQDWKNRKKVWGDLNCGVGVHDHNSRRLSHTIIGFTGKNYITKNNTIDFEAKYKISNMILGEDRSVI